MTTYPNIVELEAALAAAKAEVEAAKAVGVEAAKAVEVETANQRVADTEETSNLYYFLIDKSLYDILYPLCKLDKAIDQGLFNILGNGLKFIDDVEGFIDGSAIQQNNAVKSILGFLNTETNKAIGQPIWSAEDIVFVAKSLTDLLPNTLKTVNKALIKPSLKISKNALAKHLEKHLEVETRSGAGAASDPFNTVLMI